MKRNIVRLAVAAVLACAVLACWHWNPSRNAHPFKVHKANCLNNLREIGIALQTWSLANGGRFPWNVSTNDWGSKEFCARDADGFDPNAARHFEVMSNDLSVPLVLVCPEDKSRKAAVNFRRLSAGSVTYRLRTGTNIDRAHPREVIAVCPIDGNTLHCDGTVVAGESAVTPAQAPSAPPTNAHGLLRPNIRHRASEFTDAESAEFAAKFEQSYKPAILKWGNAFQGHVPFDPESVTPTNLVERLGKDASYNEYVFVVEGITLGVRDAGAARVDYLNDPEETRKMATLPKGQVPIMASPVTRDEVRDMLEADGGSSLTSSEIRMTPSGLSGCLNRGVLVTAGGDTGNGASWKYDVVFGPDAKLAFYRKGVGR